LPEPQSESEGIVIALAENARAEAERHAAGLPIEQGGLLIGEAW